MSALLALLAAAGWGSSDFAAGYASRKSSATSVVILTHLASAIALLAVSLLPGQGGSPTSGDLAWGLAAGVAGGAGAMLLFRGLGRGSMSVVAPVTATGAAIIPVVAGVLDGESVGPLAMLGVALALAAIIVVSLSSDDGPVDDVEADRGASADGPRVGTSAAVRPEPVLAGIGARPRGNGWGFVCGDVPLAPALAAASPAPPPPAPLPPPRPFHLPRLGVGTPGIAWPAPDPATRVAATAPLDAAAPVDIVAAGTAATTPPTAPSEAIGLGADRDPAVGGRITRTLRQPGLVDALLSGVGFGLFFVLIARTSETAGHWPLVGARGISVLMFIAIAVLSTTAVLPDRASRPPVVVAGLLDAAAAVFFVLSTRAGLLSVGAVLASLYPAATILLARVVTQERITRRQIGGLVLAGAAVSLLAV